MNEGKNNKSIAVVDLFAGLRTVHVAAEGTELKIGLSHAAEKCDFANHLSKKNKVQETLFEDVRHMKTDWAIAFVAEALALGVAAIFIIAGFPCKGLSRARGSDRENLENKDSILFWEIIRILGELKKAAAGVLRVLFAVENVMMDPDPESVITEKLGCRPVKISAGQVCAANRDRLFWCNFPIEPGEGESMTKNKHRNELTMKKNLDKLNIWDKGWGAPPNFRGSLPTVQGWKTWNSQPRDPRGITVRSKDAIKRWENDKFSTAITFYEDYNMAYRLKDGKADQRHVSPTETERLLGFPENWTEPGPEYTTEANSRDTQNQRRNAVGNAFAVPVIRRILTGLCVALQTRQATSVTSRPGPSNMISNWSNNSLAAPFHPDVLDDLWPQFGELAEEFKDLTEEFDAWLPEEWSGKLVGPDPGAGGRKNRSERAAMLEFSKAHTYLGTASIC